MIGLLAITSIPTVTGVSLATSEQRKANQRKEEARRMVKFNIIAECDGDTDDDRELNGMTVVVRDEKVSKFNENQIRSVQDLIIPLNIVLKAPIEDYIN